MTRSVEKKVPDKLQTPVKYEPSDIKKKKWKVSKTRVVSFKLWIEKWFIFSSEKDKHLESNSGRFKTEV